ncbi:adenylosuccinate lyase [Confluentibacter sediminis]|uniref:adenylosuccinate lyase n=1 Tax=Confluentibacter sediminis TaxID=2219045 RepID=UPI000DAE76FB|nr:adenylosuccinate lyase [Confluentibacter sediminis]
MTKDQLYNELTKVSASRESRLTCAQLVKNNMSLFPDLIDILFNVNDENSCHAAWVFEFVCADYMYAIIPYLDTFTKKASKIHLDSAMRPVAKVCSQIATAYYSKENNTFKRLLKPEHKKRLVETCFDWMINKHKVAVKVFAMETLFLFGQDNAWIHKDLKQILEQDAPTQSPAYKSRAKHILIKMKKTSKS